MPRHKLSAGRTASPSGVFVFYRKLITYVLLVLYGVPTAVGPHWHSHCRHNLDVTCNTSAASDPTAISPSAPKCFAAPHLCNCHRAHSTEKQPHSDRSTQIVASDSNCDGCLICHFYACVPFAGLALAAQVDGSLVECLPIERQGHTRSFEQLHLARGPPATLALI
ncbi:MAG: hypothetical protein SFV81_07215 [Pirellulaceae bacterium]|nr:hypothetical protein [Pirellulaceae bacterium]